MAAGEFIRETSVRRQITGPPGPRRLLLALAVLALPAAAAADWPRFGGPDANFVSPEVGLARTWPAGGPATVWKVPLAKGWAGAVVRDGEVYLLDRDEGPQRDVLRCLDLQTGRAKWDYAFDSRGKLFSHPGSRGLPTVDATCVYLVGTFGQVLCVDRRTHRPIWRRHLVDDFPGTGPDSLYGPGRFGPEKHAPASPAWGQSQVPTLYRDTVILAPLTDTVGVAAFDRKTGRTRWKSPYAGRNWFAQAAPCLTNLGGVDQVVVLANSHPPGNSPARVSSVDARTGKLLWSLVTWRNYKIPVPMPVRVAPGRLFLTGGYGIGCFGLDVRRDGERWTASYAFRSNDVASHLHTPVFYRGHVFSPSYNVHFVPNSNGLVCLDPAGRVRWKTGRDLILHDGSLLAADGMLLAMNARTGELHLIEANPAAFRPLAKAKVLDAPAKTAWAPMALSRGLLLVRDTTTLKCLDLRAKGR